MKTETRFVPVPNAKLIAAAPDMLKVLEQCERAFNVTDIDPFQAFAMIERIKEVIAKATE